MKHLRAWRVRAGYFTQTALADAAGVGQNQISTWEAEEPDTVPSLENASKLVRALNAKLGTPIGAQDLLEAPPALATV